jgi:hypothetical protein
MAVKIPLEIFAIIGNLNDGSEFNERELIILAHFLIRKRNSQQEHISLRDEGGIFSSVY